MGTRRIRGCLLGHDLLLVLLLLLVVKHAHVLHASHRRGVHGGCMLLMLQRVVCHGRIGLIVRAHGSDLLCVFYCALGLWIFRRGKNRRWHRHDDGGGSDLLRLGCNVVCLFVLFPRHFPQRNCVALRSREEKPE